MAVNPCPRLIGFLCCHSHTHTHTHSQQIKDPIKGITYDSSPGALGLDSVY